MKIGAADCSGPCDVDCLTFWLVRWLVGGLVGGLGWLIADQNWRMVVVCFCRAGMCPVNLLSLCTPTQFGRVCIVHQPQVSPVAAGDYEVVVVGCSKTTYVRS